MARDDNEYALAGLVRRVLEKHPAFNANPLGDWEELLGEQIAHRCQPKSLKNKVLRVVVEDSHWKHHLHMNQEALLAKINHGQPEAIVEKLVLVVGEIPASMPVLNPNHTLLEKIPNKSQRGKKRKAPLRDLTPEENELLQGIGDRELRRLCTRLLRRVSDDPPSA
jgi:hypothetical protein